MPTRQTEHADIDLGALTFNEFRWQPTMVSFRRTCALEKHERVLRVGKREIAKNMFHPTEAVTVANPKQSSAAQARLAFGLHRSRAAFAGLALREWGVMAMWTCALTALGVLAAVKLDLSAQYVVSFSLLAAMLVVRHTGGMARARLFFLLCSGFLTFRYLYWRTTSTLGYNGMADFVFMLLLYGAELYGIVISTLGLFVNARPLRRQPVPLITTPGALPSIDVFIPTYNEPPELLQVTLRAALDMRYPRELLHVYLLDDGGTHQKLTQADPAKAREARERSQALKQMVARHGGTYLARERNEHAKAGNINAALEHTRGDLIVIFDADHVPTVDFLEKTVGHFQRDDKLYLVQTPHFFINPDPLEKNLGMFGRMPPENEMFYSVVQRGLDFWNASFFCGSAALLRRRCLEEIGGIAGNSITEDAETALTLHARGYHSRYVDEALISGLQPETFSSFIVQRVRWAQGMVQLFLLSNPLRLKGLSLPQRLCYFSNAFFWFFCFARVVFLFAPVMYLVFGLQFYNATLPQFFAYGLPQMIGAILASDYLFGRYRWTLISEVYELLQSMFSLRAVISVMINPRAPGFKVTPKGEKIEEDSISELAAPFYIVYVLVVVGIVVGVWKLLHGAAQHDVIVSALAWSGLNLVLLNACIGVLFERKQRRAVPRVPANLDAVLHIESSQRNTSGASPIACHIADLSGGGLKAVFAPEHALRAPRDGLATLEVFNAARGCTSRIPVTIRNAYSPGDGSVIVGAQFADDSVEGMSERVSLVFGDSGRWRDFRESRNRRIGILRSLLIVLQLGSVHAIGHYRVFIGSLLSYAAHPWRAACAVVDSSRPIHEKPSQ